MDRPYLVLEFACPAHGPVKRVPITRKLILSMVTAVILLGCGAGLVLSAYVQMGWKAAQYDRVRANLVDLRGRYRELQRILRQHNDEMASLESLANEVSAAYGIRQPDGSGNVGAAASNSDLTPTLDESVEQYNFLKAAEFSSIYHHYAYQWQSHAVPSLWPVRGVLCSSFGGRLDPFSGEGAFHTGVDLSAARGTQVHVTADGIVSSAGWSGDYGKLVVVDHGNGLQTYYAHLSQTLVVPGQEVRAGQVIALSGGTGRATSPHLHYEVRVHGTPVNPYKYLAKSNRPRTSRGLTSDLGL